MKANIMALVKDYLKMTVCFLIGAFVTSTPALFYVPEAWIFVMGYGLVCAMPAFAAAMIIYGVFRSKINARPTLWCTVMTVIMAGGVMGAMYAVFKDFLGIGLFVTGFVLLGTTVATVLFRLWALSRSKREQMQKEGRPAPNADLAIA